MFAGGIALIIFNVVMRGFLFPAEYSLGNDTDEVPRVFFNPINAYIYWLIEKGTRWGGSILIAFEIVGFNCGFMEILSGGMLIGGIGAVISPMLSMWLAFRIHPYFRQTLKSRNTP